MHIALGVWAARMNRERNRPWQTGFAWGFSLGWIGIAVVAFRGDKLTPEAQAVFKALDEHRARRLEGLAASRKS
jgi:hypothetical protein